MFHSLSARTHVADDPFRLLRLVVGGLLLGATVVALLMAVTGVDSRALLLAGAAWALYGLFMGFVDGVLEPLIHGVVRLFGNVGLVRIGAGFSEAESLVARGRYQEAAEAYQARARAGGQEVEATVRRAALLAGPLAAPLLAANELTDLRRRTSKSLTADDDVRIGLALVDIYDYRLEDPGKAMAELRRLIDHHPGSRHVRRMRDVLRGLKARHFGAEHDESPDTSVRHGAA